MQESTVSKKNQLWNINFKDFLWMFFLFLFLTNFMRVGIYLPLILIPYIFIYLINNRFGKFFWITLFSLLAFSLTYSYIAISYEYVTIGLVLIYITYPVLLFILGYKIIHTNSYKKMVQYTLFIVVTMTFFGFLSVVKTLILYGSMEAASIHFVGRYAVDLWSNEPISATVINLRFSLGLALLPILFLAKDKYTPYVKSIKLISLVCFIASFYSIILLGNRTGIAIAIISFLIVFIISRKISLKKVSNLFVIVMSIILFAILYNNNWLGLKASWQASALSYRLQSNSSLEDPRVNAWIESFLGMFTNPLGGKKSDIGLTYAHNLWLDVGYETGILPFLLLIGFTIIPLTVLITFLKKNHHVIFKGLFLAIFTAFFISFFLEPIIQAWFPYFTIFCFFIGIIQKINLKTKEKKIL